MSVTWTFSSFFSPPSRPLFCIHPTDAHPAHFPSGIISPRCTRKHTCINEIIEKFRRYSFPNPLPPPSLPSFSSHGISYRSFRQTDRVSRVSKRESRQQQQVSNRSIFERVIRHRWTGHFISERERPIVRFSFSMKTRLFLLPTNSPRLKKSFLYYLVEPFVFIVPVASFPPIERYNHG